MTTNHFDKIYTADTDASVDAISNAAAHPSRRPKIIIRHEYDALDHAIIGAVGIQRAAKHNLYWIRYIRAFAGIRADIYDDHIVVRPIPRAKQTFPPVSIETKHTKLTVYDDHDLIAWITPLYGPLFAVFDNSDYLLGDRATLHKLLKRQ